MVNTYTTQQTFLDDASLTAVKKSITKAEKNTVGEIVVVVARKSGRYDRGEDIVGVLFALCLLSIAWLFSARPLDPTAFDSTHYSLGLLPILAIIVAGFAVGSGIATIFSGISLPFTPEKELDEEVNRRAAECFYHYGIGNTTGETGILIFISLLEHRVVVKGDRAISEELDRHDWNEVCTLITDGIKNNAPEKGLPAAIALCGKQLTTHFPSDGKTPNQLHDMIHFVD